VLWLLNPNRDQFFELLALDPEALKRGQVWRLFTFAFIPQTTSAIFILFVTWFLIWIGTSLENAWGAFKLNVYFFLAIAGLAIAALFVPDAFAGGLNPADSLLYSTHFLAFATLFPNEQILLFFFIPVRVKWLGWVAALGLLVMFGLYPSTRWAIVLAHLNYAIFFGPELWNHVRHRSRVEMRRRKFESQQLATSDAFHRCHGCGKTDQSDPHLEFRVADDGEEYCVQCLPQATAGRR
jgi:hypothetical protein